MCSLVYKRCCQAKISLYSEQYRIVPSSTVLHVQSESQISTVQLYTCDAQLNFDDLTLYILPKCTKYTQCSITLGTLRLKLFNPGQVVPLTFLLLSRQKQDLYIVQHLQRHLALNLLPSFREQGWHVAWCTFNGYWFAVTCTIRFSLAYPQYSWRLFLRVF